MRTTASRTIMLTLAAFGGFAAVAPTARADVIYTFTTTSATNNAGDPAVVGTLPLSVTLDLTNAVVQSGLFSLASTGPGTTFTKSSGLVSLLVETGTAAANDLRSEKVTPASLLPGIIDATFRFNAAGFVTSSGLVFNGALESAILTGTGTGANGFVGSSSATCGTTASSGVCGVIGSWTSARTVTSVPEPASLALLGGAVLAGLAARRRPKRSAGMVTADAAS